MGKTIDEAERVALAGWFATAGGLMELGHRLTVVGQRWLAHHRTRTALDAPIPIGRTPHGAPVLAKLPSSHPVARLEDWRTLRAQRGGPLVLTQSCSVERRRG